MVPITVPGGNPVIAVPGLIPMSPVTWVAPVLVTVEPARTAKSPAAPRATVAGLAAVRLRALKANVVNRKNTLIFFMDKINISDMRLINCSELLTVAIHLLLGLGSTGDMRPEQDFQAPLGILSRVPGWRTTSRFPREWL